MIPETVELDRTLAIELLVVEKNNQSEQGPYEVHKPRTGCSACTRTASRRAKKGDFIVVTGLVEGYHQKRMAFIRIVDSVLDKLRGVT